MSVTAAAVALYWGATQFQIEFPVLVYQAGWLWFLAALVVVDRWPLTGLALAIAASCIREEYQFAALLLAAWIATSAWRHRWRATQWWARRGNVVGGVISTVIAGGLVVIVLSRSQFTGGGNRVWFAFQQHYAVRATEVGAAGNLNPWTDYSAIVQKDFAGARSLSEAWKLNAPAVLRHVQGRHKAHSGRRICR